MRCFLILLMAAAQAWALPQHSGLFEQQYRYKPHCSLCHQRRTGKINTYGKAFLQGGASSAAMAALEKPDIDKDGYFGLDEIKAHSNPGDPQSTPVNPGKWLQASERLRVPKKLLRRAFPQARRFRVLERWMTSLDMERLKKAVGQTDALELEQYTVLFLAQEGRRIVGAASYVPIIEETMAGPEMNVFLLSANPNGKILRLEPVRVYRKVLQESVFVKQFQGIWPEGLGAVSFASLFKAPFREHFRAQVAKYAYLIDIAIAP